MAGQRWDRDRLTYERDRLDDERYLMRGARGGRDDSRDRYDRRRAYDDDDVLYDEEPRRFEPRPPAPDLDHVRDRRGVLEKERDRDPETRRPAFLRRQSSLDTFDRRRWYGRPEHPPPARREDVLRDNYRAPAYTPIPLPKTRALPPRHPDGAFYDDINVADPAYYGDDDYRPYPLRERELELVRSRERRERSRDSRATRTHTHRSSSSSSAASTSRSSSSARGTTVRSEYPKKGRTKIPARLMSKRALIDLGYPFIEEGNTIIVQKALGQHNIDELLKLSEDYNKADQDAAARVIEERREEVFVPPPPPPLPPAFIPPPPPAVVDAPPRASEFIEKTKTVIRDVSPARTATTSTSACSWDSHHRHHQHHHHDDLVVGPLIERSRSRSRSGRDIRAEIRALERELVHRPRGELGEREVVRTERLPDGELIVYQETVERQVAGPKPPRIEKDKKGRMSISVPKYR